MGVTVEVSRREKQLAGVDRQSRQNFIRINRVTENCRKEETGKYRKKKPEMKKRQIKPCK